MMQTNKQRKKREGAQNKEHGYVKCQMCGRKIDPDACIWQEDDEGALYCQDCEAERESCGCSD